jgi:hypothetical protein
MNIKLTLSTYDFSLKLSKETDVPTQEQTITVLSVRDPDQSVELRTDYLWFNPLLKKNDWMHLYSLDADHNFTSIYSGKSLKGLKKEQARGWFGIAPITLTKSNIPAELLRLIIRSPQLSGVIGQMARASLGLRIPPDLNCQTKEDWVTWFNTQVQPLSSYARHAFNNIRTGTSTLGLTSELRTYLETGREPEPIYELRIRWCELRTFTSVRRKLFESAERDLTVTTTVLNQGKEAVLNAAEKLFGLGWNQVEEYETGEDIVTEEIADQRLTVPIILMRQGTNWVPFGFTEKMPISIHDLFTEAVTSTARH